MFAFTRSSERTRKKQCFASDKPMSHILQKSFCWMFHAFTVFQPIDFKENMVKDTSFTDISHPWVKHIGCFKERLYDAEVPLYRHKDRL